MGRAGEVVQIAGVVAEVELRQIAAKVLFAAMLVGAFQAALEARRIALGGVGMGLASGSFLAAVCDALAGLEFP